MIEEDVWQTKPWRYVCVGGPHDWSSTSKLSGPREVRLVMSSLNQGELCMSSAVLVETYK